MRRLVSSSVLALEPNARGLSFVFFEQEGKLADWGIHEIRNLKNIRCRRRALTLLRRLQPDFVVMENTHAMGARRQRRIIELLGQMKADANQMGLQVSLISKRTIQEQFCVFGTGSKDDIATAIATMVPELAEKLPSRRRIWESEHYNMGMFEAAALAISFYAQLVRTR